MSLYDQPAAGCSLAELLERVLPLRVTVLTGSADLGALFVHGTVLAGLGERLPDLPDRLLLLVGDGDAPRVAASVREAAARGFGAVLLRAGAPAAPEALRAATEAGVSLLSFDSELNWREVAALLDAVIESHWAPPDGGPAVGIEELYVIADAVAATIGGSVSIEDLSQRVVAYSSVPGQLIDAVRSEGILDRSAPHDPGDRERYGRILRSDGVVRFERMGDELARAAMAVKAGDLPLGTIWAIEGEHGIGPQDEAALRQGARLAALHLLRARDTVELDHGLRGDALRSLIDGTENADAARIRLRLRDDVPRALLAFGFEDTAADRSDSSEAARAAQDVARQVTALRPGATITVSGGIVYVLLVDERAAPAASSLAESITSILGGRTRRRLFGAVAVDGDAARPLTELRAEADDVLAVLAARADRPVAALGDVRVDVILSHVAAELTRTSWLRDAEITRIFTASARNREIAASVAAWFDARFEVSRAAQALKVHPNTLRYRLRRFSELTGVDLEDADACLGVWLQLRTHPEMHAS
ncbi:PucR family transcriptional regulator [Streptomyces sp. NPDC091281]|uniref:PucR family transcriptional regulator n=1 Tax=Streptomyces sp. NPDC091281 TaxID=3365985 RepID=UPI0038134A9B